jgi:putative tryptophan/tyrosine transport system substrate-binding protein
MPVIGYLDAGSPEPSANLVTAFRRGLSEMGYVEGQNIAIQYCWAEGQNDRLPKLAAYLVNSNVAAIAAPEASAPALALKSLTATIPIIFSTGADPVRIGLITSMNRPGGNITGISSMSVEVGGKRLEFLCQLVPRAVRLALLTNPTVALSQSYSAEFHAVAGKRRSLPPARLLKSTAPLRTWSNTVPTDSRLLPTICLSIGALSLPDWPCGTPSLRFFRSASTWKRVDS